MSAPSSSQVYRDSNIADSGIFVTVSVTGAAGPALQKQLMDGVQEAIGSRVPGAFPRGPGDDGVQRVYIVTEPPIGEHVPTTHDNELHPTQGQSTHGSTDVDMNPPPETFYREAGSSDLATHPSVSIISDLESQVAALRVENGDLKQSLQQKNDEKDGLGARLNKAVQERDDLVRQRQVNLLKIRKLNDMIIKNSQKSDEPLDEEILQETFRVRNMATEVIKTYFPGDAKFRPDLAKRLDDYYRHFYEYRILPDRNPERRRRLLISIVFGELQVWFFGPNAKRFGVPKEMERELQQFERQIEASNKVETEEALEWRTRTVSYASRLNLNSVDMVARATQRLLAVLEPMSLPGADKHGNADKKEWANLENALYELCSAALKLTLRFRSSKTKYEFKVYPDNTSLAACDEDLIRKLDADGPISRPLDPSKLQIFCTLFGALVKTRPPVSGEPGETAILEKGHIIIHEPQLRAQPHNSHVTA